MRANRRAYDDCGISGPYRQFKRSHWPTEFERQPKKPAESDKLASAESEIQVITKYFNQFFLNFSV